MPNEHRADPTPPPHHGQGRGGSKKESSSLRVSPALHPPERPSPRRADIADHGLGREKPIILNSEPHSAQTLQQLLLLLLALRQNGTRDAHKISPHGAVTKRQL